MRILGDSDPELCVIVITLKVQFLTFLSLFSHNSPCGLGIEELFRIVYVKDRTWMGIRWGPKLEKVLYIQMRNKHGQSGSGSDLIKEKTQLSTNVPTILS